MRHFFDALLMVLVSFLLATLILKAIQVFISPAYSATPIWTQEYQEDFLEPCYGEDLIDIMIASYEVIDHLMEGEGIDGQRKIFVGQQTQAWVDAFELFFMQHVGWMSQLNYTWTDLLIQAKQLDPSPCNFTQ